MKKGMLIKIGEDLFRVLDLQHVTPGNLRGFVRVKFRNIRTGSLADQKLRSEDFVERAVLDERQMQYMYKDGDSYHFMDTETYEQSHITAEALGESVNYLIPDAVIAVEFYGSEPVGIELPVTVDLKVTDTVPGHQRSDGQQPDQARDARDRSRRQRAAVHQPRRHRPHQHRNRRIPFTRLDGH